LQVSDRVRSAAGLDLTGGYNEAFIAVSDFNSRVRFEFNNPRSDRKNHTVSYDVTITNISDQDLLLPVMLQLDPAKYFRRC
jgi:hypothetical protein